VRFTRHQRLTDKVQFNQVLRHRRYRQQSHGCRIYALPNSLDHPRLGLIVGKRQVRLAVTRNRLKRVIRESFRQHQQELPPVDVVVQMFAAPSNAELQGILSRLWQDLAAAWPAMQHSQASPDTGSAQS
jgi:ribonuclease P protein component